MRQQQPTQGAVGMQEGNYIAENDNAIKEIIEKQQLIDETILEKFGLYQDY